MPAENPEPPPGKPSLVFRLAEHWFALPIAMMEEVGEARPIHSLPHQNAGVLGVVNVRGELLICVAAAQLLGLRSESEDSRLFLRQVRGRLLVIRLAGERLALPVDEVRGVRHLVLPEVAALVVSPHAALSATVHCEVPWEGLSLGCLDGRKFFEWLNRCLA